MRVYITILAAILLTYVVACVAIGTVMALKKAWELAEIERDIKNATKDRAKQETQEEKE